LFRIPNNKPFYLQEYRSLLKRLSWYTLATLACFSTVASADLKIKTRSTVVGHTTESTVYIKGPRQRTDMSFGRGNAVSITQCDQKA
jgi:hypothetical protein